jgi:hypothetical protein
MKTMRVTAVSIVSVLVGAMLGATFLGTLAYIAAGPNQTIFGPNWWKAAALGGAVYATLPGFIVGLAVGLSNCGKVVGTLIGGGVGLVLTAMLLLLTDDFFSKWDSIVVAVAVIPLGSALGLIVAIVSASLSTWQRTQVRNPYH